MHIKQKSWQNIGSLQSKELQQNSCVKCQNANAFFGFQSTSFRVAIAAVIFHVTICDKCCV